MIEKTTAGTQIVGDRAIVEGFGIGKIGLRLGEIVLPLEDRARRRQPDLAAFEEISQFFGGKSHSVAGDLQAHFAEADLAVGRPQFAPGHLAETLDVTLSTCSQILFTRCLADSLTVSQGIVKEQTNGPVLQIIL